MQHEVTAAILHHRQYETASSPTGPTRYRTPSSRTAAAMVVHPVDAGVSQPLPTPASSNTRVDASPSRLLGTGRRLTRGSHRSPPLVRLSLCRTRCRHAPTRSRSNDARRLLLSTTWPGRHPPRQRGRIVLLQPADVERIVATAARRYRPTRRTSRHTSVVPDLCPSITVTAVLKTARALSPSSRTCTRLSALSERFCALGWRLLMDPRTGVADQLM